MKRVEILLSACVVCLFVVGARGDDLDSKLPTDDAFLVKVASCNHAVTRISKMAETQGSPDVKAFAVQIGKEHQVCSEKLADLLKNRKVGVVTGAESETKATISRLGELKGTDFDREYLKWVVKEHRDGIPLMENQIKQGKDEDVRAFAKEGLVSLRKHLQMAEDLTKTVSSK